MKNYYIHNYRLSFPSSPWVPLPISVVCWIAPDEVLQQAVNFSGNGPEKMAGAKKRKTNRSGWVCQMMLLASIVTVGYILVQYTEKAPLLRVGVAPAPLTDMPPAFHSREKCLFCHDFET